jgi:hypothetical protein
MLFYPSSRRPTVEDEIKEYLEDINPYYAENYKNPHFSSIYATIITGV